MRKRLAFFAVAVTLVAVAGYTIAGQGARAAGESPDAFSIDVNPASAPANTSTSLGSREACARINENNTLDADEDVTADTVTVDATVTNIPASNPMIAFNYVLNYDETNMSVQSANHSFILAANAGSTVSSFSDGTPDTDNSDDWLAIVLDISESVPESGSGVLSRLTISSDSGAAAGTYPLTLTEAAVVDPTNQANPPDVINNATIAVDQGCALVQGDVDCSGAVLATDALKVLRFVAGLSVSQGPGCPVIGSGAPFPFGDVDCSGAVLATDALKILRFIAGLSVAQGEGCAPIGA